jgi:iron complex transport system substrate-binding protein
LRPTLVVIYSTNPELEALCKRRNIATIHTAIEGIVDIWKTIDELGRATGHTDQAAKLVKTMRAKLDAIQMRAAGKPRPRVLVTVGRDAGSFQNVLTIGRASFLDELVTLAGGQNVFHEMPQPYPQVSSEQIIASAPEVVIELAGETGVVRDVERKKKDWAVFKSVPAAQNGRIHFLASDYLLIPGPRMVNVAEDFVKALHP